MKQYWSKNTGCFALLIVLLMVFTMMPTNVFATENETTAIDANDQIVLNEVTDEAKIQTMQEKLSEDTILSVWNIQLDDQITGEVCELTESVEIKIPLTSLGDYSAYDGLAVVQYTEDGNLEFLNAAMEEENIVFDVIEASDYAVIGYKGVSPMEEMLTAKTGETDSEGMAWLPWTIAGGCGVVLLAVFWVLKSKKETQVEK